MQFGYMRHSLGFWVLLRYMVDFFIFAFSKTMVVMMVPAKTFGVIWALYEP